MLASATLVNSAFCASARWSKNTVGVPPCQYGWWDKDQWRGGWVLAVVGCATAISGFTVGGSRAVSPLMSTVPKADEASTAVESSSVPDRPSTVRTGDLVVDLNTHVASLGGKPVRLTGKEYAILELLTLRKGGIVTREMLLDHLYGGTDEPELKIIDVFVCKLRKKLAQAEGGDHYIETVWGRGYILHEQVKGDLPFRPGLG